MIDWEKTKEKFGYSKEDLAPTTQQHKVVWKCDNPNCDAEPDKRVRELVYGYAKKKEDKAKAEGKPCVCQKCSHAHRKGKMTRSKNKTALPLPPEVNREKTYEYSKTLGGEPYYPEQLSDWSRRPIVLTFEGQDYTIPRANLNTLESVKKWGIYRPVAWWTQQRRKNKKASSKTREKQKLSQRKRRDKERKDKENYFQNQGEVLSVDFTNDEKKIA